MPNESSETEITEREVAALVMRLLVAYPRLNSSMLNTVTGPRVTTNVLYSALDRLKEEGKVEEGSTIIDGLKGRRTVHRFYRLTRAAQSDTPAPMMLD